MTMTYDEGLFVLGSLFGLYLAGWVAGFTIHMIKVYLEKI